MDSRYRGRFAPSPSGPLHLGSLVTALASWLEARRQGGAWLVRMEDLDRARVRQCHADDILRTLEDIGLYWDEDILYQSTRDEAYAAATQVLSKQDLVYACSCTRRELSDSLPGIDGPVYPGTCRNQFRDMSTKHALRIKVNDAGYAFTDRIQGTQHQMLARDVGDFILRRSDGLYAYQLAVVTDDADQGISDVVRGADLLNSTPRQNYLQELLGYPMPGYAHVPLLTDGAGDKLSKRGLSDPVACLPAGNVLFISLQLLGQQPPPALARSHPKEILAWAQTQWDLSRVPRLKQVVAPSMA